MGSGWIEAQGALKKEFLFDDFAEALAFVDKVGELAERLQHHPDLCIKDYRKVVIQTTTHDAGSTVTDKDWRLANSIDEIA